ncbi:Uncharacterized conserved protein [Metamycoplasma arthritidis]|uniref:MspA/MspB/MIB-like signal-anchor domain-contatining protein n=1 Tax=Metamycoplasma arthritidis TaxID=2111 RepID=UPI001004DAD1|nr:DUF2924 domain-containing protein [Metamycoplasma arthritidis]VEU78837.1 Uncharacterized conserved protein [Metamycoplasma arthritidis]
MSHAKKKKIAIIALSATAALLAAGTISGVLYSHSKESKKGKDNNKLPEVQDISELEKKIEAIRDSHKQNLKSEAWKILEALKITIKNAKKANNSRDLTEVISDFVRLIPLAEAYLGEIKKLPELKALAEELATTIDLSKEALKESKDKLKELEEKETKLKKETENLLKEIEETLAKVPNVGDLTLEIQKLINKLKDLKNTSEALQEQLLNSRLVEDAKKLNDANLKIKDAINKLQKRLLEKSPEELEKLAKEKIQDLEKSKKAVDDAKNISTLPNALESLKKDIETAKEIKEQANSKGLDELSKKLEDAIKEAESTLEKGKQKQEQIEKENEELKQKIDALVTKVNQDLLEVNKLTLQSEDSDFNKLKNEIEKDIQDATDLAKKAADATLLEYEDKALNAKKLAQTALDKLNELFNQKKEQELAKVELEKAYSALVSATEDTKKANDENTLPLAISKLETAISNASTSLAKYEALKEKELVKPIYGALEKSLETATKTLEDAKKRLESKKQEKAKIDAELKQKQGKFDAIKKTIEDVSTINNIPALQNAIKELSELKTETKALETSAKNAQYTEAENKVKKLLEDIAKLELEANVKLEKLKEEKERQEQEKKIIESLREKIEKITKNLEILSLKGDSQLKEASPKQTELAKTLEDLKEQLDEAKNVKEEIKNAKKETQLKAELDALDTAHKKAKQIQENIAKKISESDTEIENKIKIARQKLQELVAEVQNNFNSKNLPGLEANIANLETLQENANSISALTDAVESKHKKIAKQLVSDIASALLEAKTKQESLKKELENDKAIIDDINNKISEHQNTLEKAKTDANNATTIDDKKDKYKTLDETIKNIEKDIKKLEEKIKGIKDENKKQNTETKIKDLVEKLEETRADLKNKQTELETEVAKNNTEVQKLLEDADKAKKLADEAIADPKDDNKVSSAKEALDKSKADLEAKKDSLNGDSENQNKIIEKLAEIEQKEKDLVKAETKQKETDDEKAKELATKAKELYNELNSLVSELDPFEASKEYEDKISLVETKVTELEAENGFLNAKSPATRLKTNKHLEEAYKNLEELKEVAKQKASQARLKIQETKNRLQSDFDTLKEQIESIENELKSADTETKLDSLLEKIGTTSDNDKLFGKVKKLLEEISKFEKKDTIETLYNSTKALETQLNTIIANIAVAKNKLKSIEDKITELNEKYKMATEALASQNEITNNINQDDVDSLENEINRLKIAITNANNTKDNNESERVKDPKIIEGTNTNFSALKTAVQNATTTLQDKETALATKKAQNKALTDEAITKSMEAKNKINDATKLEDTNSNKIKNLTDALTQAGVAKGALESTLNALSKDKTNKSKVQTELGDLTSKIQDAKTKLDALTKTEAENLEKINDEIRKITKSLNDADDELTKQSDLKAKEDANETLKAVIDKAIVDKETQKQSINKLQTESQNQLNPKIQALETLINSLITKYNDNKAQIEIKKKTNNTKTEEALKNIQDAIKKANEVIAKENNDSTKENALNEAETTLNALKDNNLKNLLEDDLKNDSVNTKKINDKITEIDELLEKLKEEKLKLKQSQDERAKNLAIKAQDLYGELNSLVNGLDPFSASKEYEDKIKAVESKIQELEEGFLKADSEASKLKDNQNLKQTFQDLEGLKNTAKTKTEDARQNIANAKTNLKTEYESLKSEVNQIKSDFELNGTTYESLRILATRIGNGADDGKSFAKVNGLIDKIQKFGDQTQLLNDAKKLQETLNNLKAQIEQKLFVIQTEINKINGNLLNASSNLKTQNNFSGIANDDLDGLKTTIKALEEEIKRANQTKNDATAKRNSDNKIKEETQTNFDALTSAITSAEETIRTKKEELKTLQEKNNKIATEAINKSRVAKTELDNVNKLDDNSPEKINNLKNAISEAKKAKTELEEALTLLEKDVENKAKVQGELQALNAEITNAQNKLNLLMTSETEKLELIERKLEEIRNSLNTANQNLENQTELNAKETANEALKVAITDAKSNIEAPKNNLNNIHEESARKRADEKIKELENFIKSLEQKYQDTKEQIAQDRKIKVLVTKANEFTRNINQLASDLENLTIINDIETKIAELQEKLGKANNFINESDTQTLKEKNGLKESLIVLKTAITNTTKKISDKNSELDRKKQEINTMISELRQTYNQERMPEFDKLIGRPKSEVLNFIKKVREIDLKKIDELIKLVKQIDPNGTWKVYGQTRLSEAEGLKYAFNKMILHAEGTLDDFKREIIDNKRYLTENYNTLDALNKTIKPKDASNPDTLEKELKNFDEQIYKANSLIEQIDAKNSKFKEELKKELENLSALLTEARETSDQKHALLLKKRQENEQYIENSINKLKELKEKIEKNQGLPTLWEDAKDALSQINSWKNQLKDKKNADKLKDEITKDNSLNSITKQLLKEVVKNINFSKNYATTHPLNGDDLWNSFKPKVKKLEEIDEIFDRLSKVEKRNKIIDYRDFYNNFWSEIYILILKTLKNQFQTITHNNDENIKNLIKKWEETFTKNLAEWKNKDFKLIKKEWDLWLSEYQEARKDIYDDFWYTIYNLSQLSEMAKKGIKVLDALSELINLHDFV